MKNFWLRLSTRIDALSLRERAMLFAAVLAGVVFSAYSLILGPLFAQQDALAMRIADQQRNIAQVDYEMEALVKGSQLDPDAGNRARLKQLESETSKLGHDLQAMQESLVQPEKIAPLLEAMLRSNGKLRLVSVRTLPVTGLSEKLPTGEQASQKAAGGEVDGMPMDPMSVFVRMHANSAPAAPVAGPAAGIAALAGAAKPAAAPPAPEAPPAPQIPDLVYRHGVEITVQGGYVDMVNYMAQLEAMPVRLIWGKAKLDARNHAEARLTLTLFTLGLDKKWMKL